MEEGRDSVSSEKHAVSEPWSRKMRVLPERMQPGLYRDHLIPEETREIRRKIRAFAEKEVFPLARDIGEKSEKNENFPRELFGKMADEGFFRIPFSKEDGGLGLVYPACAAAVMAEELAYMSASVAGTVNAHFLLAGKTLAAGSPLIKEKYLAPALAGTSVASFAMTEPQSGSDVRTESLITRAEKKDGGYVINGQKRYITNAGVADFVTVLASAGEKSVMLVVDLDSDGCSVSAPDKKLGNRGELTYDIYFENVEAPGENLIGKEGEGLRVAVNALLYGRTGIGASGVGMAQSAFDECVAFMNEREAFGKKISDFQHWQFLLAERAVEIENARNLYVKSALCLDNGDPFPTFETSAAKYYGSSVSVSMARDAVQIFGGLGLMVELAHDGSTYKVGEIYRDSKVGEIYEGTNEIHKMIMARSIFGKR